MRTEEARAVVAGAGASARGGPRESGGSSALSGRIARASTDSSLVEEPVASAASATASTAGATASNSKAVENSAQRRKRPATLSGSSK